MKGGGGTWVISGGLRPRARVTLPPLRGLWRRSESTRSSCLLTACHCALPPPPALPPPHHHTPSPPPRCSIDGVEDKRIVSMQIDGRGRALFVAFTSCVVRVPLSRCERHGRCKKYVVPLLLRPLCTRTRSG